MSSATAAPGAVRWLSSKEMDAWLALMKVVTLLPQALDRQLRDDAGVNHMSYIILAWLSESPDQRLPMSELARSLGISLSRLSHAASSLEKSGWLRRVVSEEDARVQIVQLTDEGRMFVELAAPGHVATVRRVVFDHLSESDVALLTDIATRVGTQLSG